MGRQLFFSNHIYRARTFLTETERCSGVVGGCIYQGKKIFS